MTGLGRLAKGEVIEMPTTAAGGDGDKMDVDGPVAGESGMKVEDKIAVSAPVTQQTAQTQQGGGGGGGKKKKKGKK